MADNRKVAIQIESLKKKYRLGVIGGGTLQADIQSWWARIRGKDDPNLQIGQSVERKKDTFFALNGIDLTVYKGERLGIIGHNGAGKSTLLKILSRVTAPTEGKICIDGRISSMLEVGTGFNPELTGRENIYLNGAILGMSKAEVDKKIEQIIEFSECSQFIDTPVKRYSSGMYVKLAFAVAAHLDSEILVMDEVLAVGDMKFQQKCLGKMSDVSQSEGRTVLYVSHNMNTIRQLCDRCIVLQRGKVIYNGDVEEAINIYMDENVNKSTQIELDLVKRPNVSMGKDIRINRFDYEKATTSYKHNEVIEFSVSIKVAKPFERVRLRTEVCYYDGSKLGLFESKTLENLQPGVHTLHCSFNPTILPSGQYFMVLDIYEINDMDYHLSLDHPLQDIFFEIVDDEEDSITWNHKYMGHVRLGKLEIEDLK